VAYAFEVIPSTLSANCGVDVIKIVTALRQRHAEKDGVFYGIDGNKGVIADMKE
jgi:T-complex protein 1 subunit gamma